VTAITVAALNLCSRHPKAQAAISTALLILASLAISYCCFHPQWLLDKHALYLPCLTCCAIVAGIYFKHPQSRKTVSREAFVFASLLFWSPLLLSFGTDQDIVCHAQCNLAGFSLITGLLAIYIGRCLKNDLFAIVACCLMGGIAMVTFIQIFTEKPFGLGRSLTVQTEHSDIPMLGDILLDPLQLRFITSVRQVLTSNGFQTGDPILCLYRTPGLPYLLGARSLEKAFFLSFQDYPHMFSSTKSFNQLPRLFITLTGEKAVTLSELSPAMQQSLSEKTCRFPQSFERIGVAPNPPLFSEDRGSTQIYEYIR
jgi:hypothetical protein